MMDDLERGSQLKGYIQRETKEKGMHSNDAYTYYFCRDFLQRLYEMNGDTFVLKGSMSQFVNLNTLVRPITDIDMVTADSMQQANDIILALTSEKDKVQYSLQNKFVTTNATINYGLICKFDNIQHKISLDLRKQKVSTREKKEMPVYFSKDQPFDSNVVSVEEHLANKIYMSVLNLQLNQKLGKEFNRLKDFYDITKILSLTDINEELVSDLLALRIKTDGFLQDYELDGNLFSKNFANENRELWNMTGQKLGFDESVTFEEAIDSTRDIISRTRR